VIKRWKIARDIAVQLRKWWHCTYSSTVTAQWQVVLLYLLYKLYCSGRLEEVHKGHYCSYRVCTEMVLQWERMVCSTAIDCCSAFRHKLLDRERCVTSNTVTMEELNSGHSSALCLHTALYNQLSHTVQLSVYTQLYITNSHTQFSSLSTHSSI
jgi:hypothetical protein